MSHVRKLLAYTIAVLLTAALFVLAAPAHPADAATECVTFELDYEVRPGPARDLIGVPVEIGSWDLPDHWLGMPGTIHVETANGPSVHWNNFLTLTTNGFTTNVTGTEDTANGVRIGDTNIDVIGPTLDASYTIGTRDSRDVPGVEGASLEGTVTICATLPDSTTTTSTTAPESSTTTQPPASSTSTLTGSTTTTSTPSTSTTTPATSTTAPTGSTTTTSPDETTTTVPDSSTSTTVPPVSTPDPTLPFTGPTTDPGIWLAVGALLTLGGAAWLSRLAVRGEGR